MPNRLAEARSPYLRMHADDPVDWYPWGAEAFAAARERDVPIFLSSGYASCHWCHVMQRESFKDPAVAERLNTRFVPVKVDRELRPDVDALYMDYVVAYTGAGGWPMSVFLTPDLVPVLGGSYFPPQTMGRFPSFTQLLDTMHELWESDRERVALVADGTLAFLEEQASPRDGDEPTPRLIDESAEAIMRGADEHWGGFGEAPKFPLAPRLLYLIAYAARTKDQNVLYAIEHAVAAMVRGGIFDQAGGGIARYSTDDAWLVPHFEKMLYDNGLLLSVLGRLYRLSAEDEYAHAARQTAAFLQRDLAAPGGGFHAALSADTEGVEGATYVWTYEQLAEALTADELAIAERELGVTPEGNWDGTTILTRVRGREEEPEAVDRVLEHLLAERALRPQPDVDTKVLTSWNALVARGLIDAGEATGDGEMTGLGVATLRVLLDAADGVEVPHALDADDGTRLLEDYAALVAACLTAYEALGDRELLARAVALHAAAMERFGEDGAMFMTPAESDLPLRPREQGDSPVPSGAATSAENATRLLAATEDEAYFEQAAAILRRLEPRAFMAPDHECTALLAMMDYLDASRQREAQGI